MVTAAVAPAAALTIGKSVRITNIWQSHEQ